MDHSRLINTDFIRVLGAIGAALILFLSDYAASAHDGHIRDMGSAQLLPSSPISQEHFGIRGMQQEGERSRNSVKMRLVHRHELESQDTQHFSTPRDRILDFIRMDQVRVKGFFPSLNKDKDPAYTISASSKKPPLYPSPGKDPAPSLSPPKGASPPPTSSSSQHKKYEELEGRVISGASFPGNTGQYFVEFFVGTPGQRFLFITDTGSDLIWVPCSLCKSCVSPSNMSSPSSSSSSLPSSPSFFPEASSTFTPVTCSSEVCTFVPPPLGATCNERSPTNCTYAYVYNDLSQTAGIFAYDTISMRSSSGSTIKIKNVGFGCGTNNAGPSITKVGGVMGLGKGPISFSSQVGHMYGKFSYCFTRFFRRKAKSALVFGDDIVGAKLASSLQYTPFARNPVVDTFYHLQIEEIKVDGKALPIKSSVFEIDEQGNGGVVIDSGTTLTFFVKPAYNVILEAFKKGVHYPLAPPTAGLPLCYNVSNIDKPRFPRISIIFKGGAIFRPPPRNYFLSPEHEIRCLGFMGSSGATVLGNLIQQNYYVEYDRLNNQLGFAKANCSTGF
eukprot:c18139_g1_i1 orf=103-1776(+)